MNVKRVGARLQTNVLANDVLERGQCVGARLGTGVSERGVGLTRRRPVPGVFGT